MMAKDSDKRLSVSKKRVLATAVALLLSAGLQAQGGLYVPSAKPVRDMQKALRQSETFQLLLFPNDVDAGYTVGELDLLDSAYRIAFDIDNPKLYTMAIEVYGDANNGHSRRRADAVYRYFAMRSHAQFPIRYARNPIHCSCNGDTAEVLRFEVPVTTSVYDYAELPESRRLLNKSVDLRGGVLVTFHNDPDACVGAARGCYVPTADSTVYGYYASMVISKGAVYAVENTKDTCPGGLEIRIDDYLNWRTIIDQYRLIPHRKQILAQAGYIVVSAKLPVNGDSCTVAQRDSIFVRIPVTQEQMDAKLKFFAKVRTSRGLEYKQLPTRKVPGKGMLALQAPVNITQLDTIYVGKRLQEKELKKYFYQVDSPTEATAFEVDGKYYVASRPGKDGEPQLKKPLRQLFRIVPDQEDESIPEKTKTPKGEEIIED